MIAPKNRALTEWISIHFFFLSKMTKNHNHRETEESPAFFIYGNG